MIEQIDLYTGRSFASTDKKETSLREYDPDNEHDTLKSLIVVCDTGYLLGNQDVLFNTQSKNVVYVVDRPQIYDTQKKCLVDTFAYNLIEKKIVSIVTKTPSSFVKDLDMSRKIAGETSRPVVLYVTFGADTYFKKAEFRNPSQNDFGVPPTYYTHPTSRSSREIMQSYNFQGIQLKRGSNIHPTIPYSSGDESKGETKGTFVHENNTKNNAFITVWESPEGKTSTSLISSLGDDITSYTSSTDTIRSDETRCRRTIIRSSTTLPQVHIFTTTTLAKQFAAANISNRRGTTILFNLPYAAQYMEQGLTSAFTNCNVFSIDAAAISRIFDTTLDHVLTLAVSLILGTSSSKVEEVTRYIQENGLVSLNIPYEKVKSLPPLSKSDDSNLFKSTPYTRSNLDLPPKKIARVVSEQELLTSTITNLVQVVPNRSRNLFKIRKNVRMTSPLYVYFNSLSLSP